MKFIDSPLIAELGDVTSNMYRLGWDERNGGNISCLMTREEVAEYMNPDKCLREIPLPLIAPKNTLGKYFVVTGTGKYFKNIKKNPEANLGLVRISDDGKFVKLLWGFNDGGKFTSEFSAHLQTHDVRLSVDPTHRVVMHTHPTYTMCMTAVVPVDEIEFTRRLWKTNTEAVVVFPEGVGVLPCMICGTNEIGEETAHQLRNHKLVTWTNHGIYGLGKNIDEAFGLIETVEKTAQVYMLTLGHVINEIPDEVIQGLADLWHLEIKPGIIGKDYVNKYSK